MTNDDDLPDWLQGFDEESSSQDSFDAAGDDDDLPNWLEGTGVGAPADPGEADEDTPEWLSGIQGAEDASPSSTDPSLTPDSDGGDDWLNNIKDQEAQDSGDAGLLEESDGGDFMDRIQTLKEENDQPAEAEQDWLSGLSGDEDDGGEDWLSGIQQPDDSISGAPLEAAEQPAADDAPDWLSEGDDDDPTGGDLAGSDLFAETDQPAPDTDFGDFSAPAAETPAADAGLDWLDGDADGGSDPAGGDLAGSDLFAETDQPAPDTDFGDFSAPAAETPAADAPAAGDVPDWVDTGTDEGEFAVEADAPAAAADAPAAEDVPDWMDTGTGEFAAETSPDQLFADAEEPISTDSPDWLQSLRSTTEDEPTAQPTALEEDSHGSSIEVPSFVAGQTGALPDWLGDMQDAASDIEIQGEIPEFTSAKKSIAPAEEVDLSGGSFDSAPIASPFKDDAGEEIDLAPAELPSWLQAMRPTEAIDETSESPGFATGTIEAAGPLQGLAGILPAEPDIVHFGDAPLPNQNLMISPTMQNHVSILQRMISQEQIAQPTSRRSIALPQKIVRWVIAILMYAVVTGSMFFELAQPPTTEKISGYTINTRNQVEQLQPGAPVLLVFDYSPGLSGEMEAAAAGLVDHLLNKQTQLILISTQPTGPGMAEKFLQGTQIDYPHIANREYINLGYVAGENAAIRSIAADIRNATPALIYGEVSLWDQPPLNTIRSINDFVMIVLITDDSDQVRAWIEQTEQPDPAQPSPPMILVISARAEPLALPYVQNGQAEGMISGVRGGAWYESGTRPRVALNYWNSISLTTSLSILIITIGSTINVVRAFTGRLTRNKKAGRG